MKVAVHEVRRILQSDLLVVGITNPGHSRELNVLFLELSVRGDGELRKSPHPQNPWPKAGPL